MGTGRSLLPSLQIPLSTEETKGDQGEARDVLGPLCSSHTRGINALPPARRAPHSLDLQCCGLNLHFHLVGGAGEQLDCAVLAEALAVYLEENRAVIGLDAQRDGKAHEPG